ncbi:MAG: phosphopantothenate/pantothenate synthetase [Candidatus Altiarchaeota archaeon]|nr:phosphopantothenate/pantothenate synthetase [Candidatus Altiarchaeota archaeon]
MLPKKHPRKKSLEIRHKLVKGLKEGLVTQAGLIAHGRGEAFDYLLGEMTKPDAKKAEEAAVALMLLAEKPVISVNGNAAALCAKDLVKLALLTDSSLEVNLFYRSKEREGKIAKELKKAGATRVYGAAGKPKRLQGISSARRMIDRPLWESDAVLVPLEDGDRTEALVAAGKKVIAIDLNPLSRTARKATITIVDNITRAIANMNLIAKKLSKLEKNRLKTIADSFNNKTNLKSAERLIRKGL